MRLIFLPIALVMSGHAYAQDARAPRPITPEQLGNTLSDPAVQAGIAGVAGALADAILDTHVGPLARYTDPRDHFRAQDTLGDLLRREDPGFDERMRHRTRETVAAAGQVASDGAAMSNELRETVRRLHRVLDATTAALATDTRGH